MLQQKAHQEHFQCSVRTLKMACEHSQFQMIPIKIQYNLLSASVALGVLIVYTVVNIQAKFYHFHLEIFSFSMFNHSSILYIQSFVKINITIKC